MNRFRGTMIVGVRIQKPRIIPAYKMRNNEKAATAARAAHIATIVEATNQMNELARQMAEPFGAPISGAHDVPRVH